MALQQLSGLDASFLYMETPTSCGHVGSISVYEHPGGDFHPYEAFRDQLEARLPLLPPFRRRMVTVPLDLDRPYWINDPDFDLDFHVRHMGLPPGGTDEQLAEQVARIMARPLDFTRPMWEVYVIEGLANGDFAILTKFHHATIDGASGVEMLGILFDDAPGKARPVLDDDFRADRVPSPWELLALTTTSLASQPRKLMRAQANLVQTLAKTAFGNRASIRRAASQAMSERRVRDIAPALPSTAAPKTPFNRSITPHRRVAFRSASLATIKVIKADLGVTVNDVVLGVCAGALRRWLEENGGAPADPLIAMVPVSIRTGAESETWTNRVSALFTPIATQLDDPVARVLAASEAMKASKGQFDLIPAETLADFTQFAPPVLATRAMRMVASSRIADAVRPPVNLVISNVPGPRHSLYLGDARLKHYFPVSMIVESQGLNITVQSYMDSLDFGLIACRELVPDLWRLADYCVEEIEILATAAGVGQPARGAKPSRRPTTKPAATSAQKPAASARTGKPTSAKPAPSKPAPAKAVPAKATPAKQRG